MLYVPFMLQCRKDKYLIKTLKSNRNDPLLDDEEETKEGYEGAIVLEPIEDLHYDAVAVSDYNSLYPSSIISENLSHETFVMDSKYDNLPGVEYHTIEYINYEYIKKGKGDALTKVVNQREPKKTCRFVRPKRDRDGNFITETRGVVPRILMNLLQERKNIRKRMKTETDAFKLQVLDSCQLAAKVVANSTYGQLGAVATSPVALKELAASCTATGRKNLLFARDYIAKEYGAVAVYGDSVAAYTPIVVKQHEQVTVLPIEQLTEKFGASWIVREDGKEVSMLDDVHVWSDKGWTQILQVVRHRLHPDKKMFRVSTSAGLVDVTGDHSMLRASGEEVRPVDLKTGDVLLQLQSAPSHQQSDASITAFHLSELFWGVRAVTDAAWLQASFSTKKAFWDDLFDAKGSRVCIDSYDQTLCALWHGIASSAGVTVRTTTTQTGLTRLQFVNGGQKLSASVTDVIELERGFEELVYDLTTSNHHFGAGVGSLVVHNTDSVFMRFDCRHPDGSKMLGLHAVRESWRLCVKSAAEVSKQLEYPHNLEAEKIISPFILLSKKRYCGGYYMDDEQTKPKIKYMGISLKRRDNAPIVKHFVAGVIDILLRDVDRAEVKAMLAANPNADIKKHLVQKAQRFVQQETRKLLAGEFHEEKFILSKSLRAEYKNPEQIAHKVLADRANERGTDSFGSSDRVPYLFFAQKDSQDKLTGEKIETPEFLRQNGLQIDYKHYLTNQIAKPVAQIFGLVLEQMQGFNRGSFTQKQLTDKDELAELVLFGRLLKDYDNKMAGNQQIDHMFSKSGSDEVISAPRPSAVPMPPPHVVRDQSKPKPKTQTSLNSFFNKPS